MPIRVPPMGNFGLKIAALLIETCAEPILAAFKYELISLAKILRYVREIYNLKLELAIETKKKKEVIARSPQRSSERIPTGDTPVYRSLLNKYEHLMQVEKKIRAELEEARAKQEPEDRTVKELELSKAHCLDLQAKYSADVKRLEDSAVAHEKSLREKEAAEFFEAKKHIFDLEEQERMKASIVENWQIS